MLPINRGTPALLDSGMPMREAAVVAMRANRLAGRSAKPTPATQIGEIIRHIPQALQEALAENHVQREERT
jgi:NAD(P)H-hydrate repair Nnr-like enzyme with NAD(P)H-hydrate dehydratase domain